MMMDDIATLDELLQLLTFQQLTPDQWHAWKARMREEPQWFVLGRSNRQNDRWQALAGPYENPEQAQRIAQALAARFQVQRYSGWPEFRTQVTSLVEVMHIYQNDVPLLAQDLEQAQAWLNASAANAAGSH